mgnify:CR=1 FL=1
MIRTQDYAKRAYHLVDNMQGDPQEEKYRTLALNFPTMILQSGLVQAIGFLMAKNKNEHALLLQHIAELLSYQGNVTGLHQNILKSDLIKYQTLTRQSLDATSWLKRYTQALLKNKEEGQDDNTGS